jgi:hypothetical protein
MAISEYRVPKLLSLVGDPVIVEAITTSHLDAGSKTILDFLIYGDDADVHYFDITISGAYSLHFNFVDHLVNLNDILKRSNFSSDNEFLNHAVDRMNGFPNAVAYFTFSVVTNSTYPNGFIRMQSIKMNDHQMVGSPSFTFEQIDFTLGVEPHYNENYRLGIRIYNGSSELLGELVEFPDLEGRVIFDISEFIEILPQPDFDLEANILSFNETCKPYFYLLFDRYGIPAVEHNTLFSSTYYAIYGQSSYMKKAIWNEEAGSFYNELSVHKSFLTLQPNFKKITPFAPELLSFLVFDATISTVKLHLKVNFTDGSSYEADRGTIGAIYGKVLQAIVSPLRLNIFEINISKTVANYTVVLRNQSNVDISQERTYILDYETYDYLRFFIFRSDYGGGYDCLRSTGIVTNPAKIEKEFGTVALPDDYTTKTRKEIQVSATRTLEFNLNWGLMINFGGNSRNWKNYIQQIELSDDIFEYINGITVPCSFITDDYMLHNDNTSIYTHSSVYRRAFVDEAYSDDDIPISGDYSDDFNEDYFN